MSFSVKIGRESKVWSIADVENKLRQLSQVDKKHYWIRKDLSVRKSGRIGRLFWTVIAKRVKWMRRLFYGVDLERSKSILKQLKPQIKTSSNQTISTLFRKATQQFNAISPKHKVDLDETPQGDGSPPGPGSAPQGGGSPPQQGEDLKEYLSSTRRTLTRRKSQEFLFKGIEELHEKMQDFEKNHKEILSLSAKSLVSLSSSSNFETKTSKAFPPLDGNGNPEKYSYFSNALLSEMTKLRLALPACLIRGLESENPEIKKAAIEEFRQLVKGYFEKTIHSTHHKPFFNVLLVLSRALYDSYEEKSEAEQLLLEIWASSGKGRRRILRRLTQQPYNIRPRSEEMRKAINRRTRKKGKAPDYTGSWKSSQRIRGQKPIQQMLTDAIVGDRPSEARFLHRQLSRQFSQEEIAESLRDAKQSKRPSAQQIAEWLAEQPDPKKISPDQLKHYAETLGYGYKSANLMILESLAEAMNRQLKASCIKVPSFLPTSDLEMQKELEDLMEVVNPLWDRFLHSFNEKDKTDFLAAKKAAKIPLKITEEGDGILKTIEKEITSYFNRKTFYSINIEEWLATHNPEFVIVRSTGKEDSEENSNAGGNESIPFIKPNVEAISQAVGKVIASYFGQKSIKQRLSSGDQTLFTGKPFLPVLIQEMVVENTRSERSKPEDIPRSGVMFTRQQGKAKGETLIQAGLGNNEGVVSSQVSVDTYRIDRKGDVASVIRDKKTRFVSRQVNWDPDEYIVEPIKNNDHKLETEQAIPDEILRDMKKVADGISRHYATEANHPKPMDVEYTIKLDGIKPTIYLLQARPLLAIKKCKPSFLDLNSIQEKDRTEGLTLLEGTASVRKVEHPDQILCVGDLPQALDSYLNASDPQKIQAIIIRKMAPGTSHEAVMLRPKGVPIIVLENLEDFTRIKQWAQHAEHEPMLIDPQRGLITKGKETVIKEGWISYPVPLEVTVPRFTLSKTLDEEITNLEALAATLTSRETEEGVKTENWQKDCKNLLERMALGDKKEAKRAFADLVVLLQGLLRQNYENNKDHSNDPDASWYALVDNHVELMGVFSHILALGEKKILPALEKCETGMLERLYSIKFLETMIFQKPSESVVGSISYASLLQKDHKLRKALKQYHKDFHIQLKGKKVLSVIELLQKGEAAFSENTKAMWKAFITHLNNLDATLSALRGKTSAVEEVLALTRKLEAVGMMPIWINLVFRNHWESMEESEEKSAVEVVEELKKVQSEDNETLDWVEEKSEELKIWSEQLPKWVNPQYAEKMIPKLFKKFTENFGFNSSDSEDSPSLRKRYLESGQLGRLALLQFMGQAVELYDCIIKQIKGSSQYDSDEKKAQDFANALKGYFAMLQSSLPMISEYEDALMTPAMGTKLSFNDYMKSLREEKRYRIGGEGSFYTSPGFDNLLKAVQEGTAGKASELLEGSPSFAVNSLAIGSLLDMNRSTHWPKTLEDYFTTFHQNLEKIRKHLVMECGFGIDALEESVKSYAEKISETFEQDLSHLDIQGSKVEAVFQIPLRFHSAKISLTIDTDNPGEGIDLYAEIFGHNSFQRWDQAIAYISFIAEKRGLSFANGIGPKIDYNKPTGVSFTLHIDPKHSTPTKLIDSIEYIYQTLSMIAFEGVKAVNALLEKMKSEGDPPSFDHVSEQFFQPALFLNMSLLNKYHQEKNDAMVLKIAKNTLLGLTRQGLHDYARSGVEIWGLQKYLAQTDYGYVPNNESNEWNSKRGLKRTATLHLIRALENNVPGAREAVDVLVKDPDLIKQIPETVEALKVALFKTQPEETQYQELMKQGKYEAAFLLAADSDERLKRFSQSLAAVNALKTLAVLKKLCATYYHGSYKKKIDTLIKDLKRTKELKKFKSSSSRQASRTKLDANMKKMHSLVATFDANAEKILDLSVSALIGLSQTESWEHASFGDFEGLNGYLGNDKTYPYAQPLLNSKKQSTARLMTAGPLYIIKCFEKLKEKGKLKNGALKSIDKLFEDYFAYGCHSLHANHYKKALFIISKGFYETSDDKESARAKLNQWWGKDPTQADGLKNDPFNLKL